jgi:hypothetical protein
MATRSKHSAGLYGGDGVHLNNEGQVGEARVLLDPTFRKVVTPQQVRKLQYKNQLQQFALNKSMGLKTAVIKGQQECPTIGDKPMNAYTTPIPEWDAKLKQQWRISRKDYRGRNVDLFCYPNGEFDGVNFSSTDPVNQPVDLSMYTYASPSDVSESLKTLVELLMPQNSITNVERQRVRITNEIVNLQKNADIQSYYKQGIAKLAKVLSNTEKYAGISTSRKAKLTKAKAKELLLPVHSAAVANIALSSVEESKRGEYCKSHSGTYKPKTFHNVEVGACVPTSAFENVDKDTDFVSFLEKSKIKKALVEYAEGVVAITEKLEDPNWEDAFYRLTKDQKRAI